MRKTKNNEEVVVTIKSKTISYSGRVTIRKAHKLLEMIADEERQTPSNKDQIKETQ